MSEPIKDTKSLLEDGKPYYRSYDFHYAALYEQGFKFWSAGPNMEANCNRQLEVIKEFTQDLQGASFLEVGCGEGYMGIIFTKMGFKYTGIDYSPNAISRALDRACEENLNVDFRVMDVFDLPRDIAENSYDVVLDWGCLNTFVIDEDRRKYLSIIRNLSSPRGRFFLIHEALEDYESFDREVTSVAEWQEFFKVDFSQLADREAWDGQKWAPVKLPKFITRCKTEQGYLTEFQQAGFKVLRKYVSGSKDQYFNAVLTPSA